MIPFSPPRIDQKIIEEVIDTLKSGWITTGPKTKLFEEKLIEYSGSEQVLCTNSATSGLELMLRWFGVGKGDEVILPAYTYCATANVVIHCGAKPVLVDSGTDYNINVELIKKVITQNTKVIMPVDIAGLPCDYDPIMELVNEKSVKQLFRPNHENQKKLGRIMVLSDAAHSLGAEYKEKKTGSLSDLTVFSFHAVKNLTTAEGGAVCINLPTNRFDNESIYKKLKVLSLHGQSKDAWSKIKGISWKYDVELPGYKCNMTDIQAAMGLAEIVRYEKDMLVKRKEIFDFYLNAFRNKNWALLPTVYTPEKMTSFHAFLIRIKGFKEDSRDAFIKKIYEKGVHVNVHFIPLPMMSYYQKSGFKISDFPMAYQLFQNEISLPVFYDLSHEQMLEVVEKFHESYLEVSKTMK